MPNAASRSSRGRARAQRLETRVTAEQKTLIERAAALQGRTVTDFVLTSVQDAELFGGLLRVFRAAATNGGQLRSLASAEGRGLCTAGESGADQADTDFIAVHCLSSCVVC